MNCHLCGKDLSARYPVVGVKGGPLYCDHDELVETLRSIFEGYGLEGKPSEEWELYEGLDLLVKHGQLILEEGVYKWLYP